MESQSANQLIKLARKRKGLTQQELADQAGVSLRTVQRIEKGTEEISGFSLKQISQILEIPLEQLNYAKCKSNQYRQQSNRKY
ncbi:helix-turn-helix domain-containing protein [Sphingobacterium multivorum]|uniref:Anaerobic benzoate catabolism transcriptional regulator n=1 Tax=Sphingobacterium multivorum TaxID=28454 RepID=A0A2X2IQA7_SPHMU|nr:helix-turn-helix transcriptional regulator [Sphingobacterium multivorum]QRQ61453.1 helix-turn-helix transcriptional regulator [Sphingobacterium multivorum]SPZ84472.1 anaerobic benzoate catabolism transcriptional regulator [Sphingobacterium multivorum]